MNSIQTMLRVASSASHSTQDTRKAMRRPMQTISPIVGHRQETVGDRPLAEG